MVIEMDLVGVVGDHRELNIVGLGDSAAEPAAVNVADGKVLEETAVPALFDGAHWVLLLGWTVPDYGTMTILPKKPRASMTASASPSLARGNVRAGGFLILPCAISTMPRV